MASEHDLVGYLWLRARYDVHSTQPLRVQTAIAGTRSERLAEGVAHRTVPSALRPAPTLADHLTFALKHEGVELEFLARLFPVIDKTELEAWIRSEPTGQYARRAGFLYEWLTGDTLDVPNTPYGNYVPALDEAKQLGAAISTNSTRWRVRDNLLGSPKFSPTVWRTDAVALAMALDVRARLEALEGRFGSDLIMKSAVWLSIKESRASFAIEHEGEKKDRIRRFAAAVGEMTGQSERPLGDAFLRDLQGRIFGENLAPLGMRRSPVFVGQNSAHGERVHYIGPHWDDARDMLAGLEALMERTQGLSATVRAALASFGFVYIHPLNDGNGRISRFLVNDVLRRDGAIQDPMVIPISATMQDRGFRPLNYDHVLERFSRPFMRRYQEQWRFGKQRIAEDGVRYDLEFDAYEDALSAWRFPDLTDHVGYMAAALTHSIDHDMQQEAQYLQQHLAAREAVKEVVEGPDDMIDRIIRSVRTNHGSISGKLKREFPRLEDPQLAGDIVAAVERQFPWAAAPDPDVDETLAP